MAVLMAGGALLSSSVGGAVGVARAGLSSTPVQAAFYYPWFPETENWQTKYNPTAGKYDSSDPTVISRHVSQAKGAGLDAFIASYWGEGSRTANRLPLILDGAAAQAFKITPYYEPTSIGATDTQLKADFDALSARSSHSAWLREDNRPVLFTYNTSAFGSCAGIERMKTASGGRFYLNAKVFTGYRNCASQPDSWHQYGPAVPYDRQDLYSTNVSPGFFKFNETSPRLGRDIARYKADLQRSEDSGAKWQLITSFNEWGEGTSIEPASTWSNSYLDATREVFGDTTTPSPSPTTPTTAPPSAGTRTGACVDGGGTKWAARSVWGSEYTDSSGVTRVKNDITGFTSASPAATTVDYSVKTYSGAGSLLQSLAENDRAFNFAGGATYLNRNPVNPPTAPGSARIVVNLGDGNDGYGNCSITFVQPGTASDPPPPTTPAPTGETIVWAAGDACDDDFGIPGCRELGNLIKADQATDAVVVLGDLQYENGERINFDTYYDAGLGKQQKFSDGRSIFDVTVPAVGNHEYQTTAAAGYYGYFGAKAGDPAKGYFTKDFGKWRIISVNTNCSKIGGCTANSPQGMWFRGELAAAKTAGDSVVAIAHHPPFSDGANYAPGVTSSRELFAMAHDGGADAFLTGHDHQYQRFGPLTKDGARSSDGLPFWVSGTGGKGNTSFSTTHDRTLSRYGGAGTLPGALRLTLTDQGTFTFLYKTTDGIVRDSGSGLSR